MRLVLMFKNKNRQDSVSMPKINLVQNLFILDGRDDISRIKGGEEDEEKRT